MPIQSDLSLTSVVYDPVLLTLTWVCVAGSENQYDGKLLLNGAEPAGTYTSWTDTGGVLTLLSALAAGSYDAQLINGDNEESNTLVGEIIVTSTQCVLLAPMIYRDCKPATLDTVLSPAPDGILIGAAGVVDVFANGRRRIIPSGELLAGFPYQLKFNKMNTENTTATDVYFLYE
jgi:hypothetical protein